MNPRYERWRWQTFAITWLIYLSFNLTRQSFSVAKLSIAFDPNVSLTRAALGQLDSIYLTVYMLGQFVFGPLGDRFGPRRILLFGLALSVVAAIDFGMSTAVVAFVLFNALQGVAQSTGWSNTNKTMSSWFSVNERGRVMGWWCTHYTVGSAIALPFAGWMMDHFSRPRFSQFPLPPATFAFPVSTLSGLATWTSTAIFSTEAPSWPAAFWGPAGVVACVLLLSWLLLRNRPEDVDLPPIDQYHGTSPSKTAPENSNSNEDESSWQRIGNVLATPRVWALAVAYFSVKLVRYALIFWGPFYVAESVRGTAFESALVAAAMPVGGFVGVIAAGYFSDLFFQARRAPAAIISLVACAAVMFLGLLEIHNAWIMASFFFLAGAFLWGPDSMISATASIDFGTKRGAGTAVGFVNGIGSIGGILGGWLPSRITTGTNWTPLFVVMFLGLIVSAAVLLPLWRVKPVTS